MSLVDELFKLVKDNPQILIILAIVVAIVATTTATLTYKVIEFKIEDLNIKIQQKNAEIYDLKGKILELQNISTVIPFEILITSPKSGDDAPASIIVSGISLGMLPKGDHLWLVVNPHTNPGRWWPQEQINTSSKLWNSHANLGGEKDIGKYDVAVVSVNDKDNQYYEDYLKKGNETGNYPPLQPLASANTIYTITLNRK